MRDPNIKAALTLVITKVGDIGLSKSEQVDDDTLSLFVDRMNQEADSCGLCTFEKAFFTYTAWYNGEGDVIEGFIDWLKSEKAESLNGNVSIKEARRTFNEIDPLIGSLVMMFGDYGTSPRSGWIEDVDGAIAWLKGRRKYWEDEE